MNKTWYNITHAAEGSTEAEVSIYDAIGGEINAKNFANDLKEIDAETIHLRINSPGGCVIDGNAICNALQRHSAKVITHIDGQSVGMNPVMPAIIARIKGRPATQVQHNPKLQI